MSLARSSLRRVVVYRRPGIALGVLIALSSGGASLSLFGVVPELLTAAGARPRWLVRLELPAAPTRTPPAHARSAAADPLEAPRCEGLMLTAVTESADTGASLASFRETGAERGVTRAFRGNVGTRRVVFVGENPRRRSPAAWLLEGRALCQVVMRDPPVAPREPAPPSRGHPGITRTDAHDYRVDRALLDRVLERPELLGARLDLGASAGERGVRLARVDPNALLGQLGLRSGDRIESINGFDLGDPKDAVTALARLSRAERLHARVVRGGASFGLDVRFW